MSPGLDQIVVYWLKNLTSTRSRLALQFQSLLDGPNQLPEWMISGRTTLILKDPRKGTVASNYRPITCLPTL